MNVTFKKTQQPLDLDGGLLCELVGADTAALKKLFGRFHPQATKAPSDGYKGQEWWFMGSDGVLMTLYCRWNVWRIGGTPTHLKAFLGWLQSQASEIQPTHPERLAAWL